MIRANELRIGNLVEVFDESPVKVLAISDKNIALHFDSTKHMVAELHQIVPIPLTEEWLVKFGFESDNYEFQETYLMDISTDERYDYKTLIEAIDMGDYTNIYIKYIERENQFDYSNVFIKRVTHVHQLQNLYFALTGEELTIKK